MKRLLRTAMVLAILAAASMASTSAAAAVETGSRGYLIGARAPLTQAQTQALKDAGAQVTNVYKNFGGAAAVIPDSKLSAVRALSLVTSVNQDTLRQLAAVGPVPGTTALPGRPYWQDLIDAEKNSTYNGSGVWVAVLDSGFTQLARLLRRERHPDPVRAETSATWRGRPGRSGRGGGGVRGRRGCRSPRSCRL